jgi:hypothetical protein
MSPKSMSQNPKILQMNAISRIYMHMHCTYLDQAIGLYILMQLYTILTHAPRDLLSRLAQTTIQSLTGRRLSISQVRLLMN